MTIDIDDALYEQLIALSNEIATQDNRATGKPYLFQIETDVKIWRQDLEGAHVVLLDREGDELGPFSHKTIVDYCEYRDMDIPAWASIIEKGLPYYWSSSLYNWDWFDWFEKQSLRLVSYDIGHKLENGFLTESACKRHIKQNAYHYDNPRDYLSHCFRNPELELIYRFLDCLLPQSITADNGTSK